MQQHHSQPFALAKCCPGRQPLLPAPATGTARGHTGRRQDTPQGQGQQAAVTLLVAQERAPELDLPPQRAGLEPEGSINPQNVALGIICSRKKRAQKRYLVIKSQQSKEK